MAYTRRFLPSLLDHQNRVGAFATNWSGWRNPRNRFIELGESTRPSHPERAWHRDLWDGVGCYAILYEPSPSAPQYVAYIGSSKNAAAELRKRVREKLEGRRLPLHRFRVTIQAVYGLRTARLYEDDLIRYYAPTWNTRFNRAGTPAGI